MGQLYLGCSQDGVDWKLTSKPVLQRMLDNTWDISLYKSSFQPRFDNGELVFDVWYAATGTDIVSGKQWHIGKSVLRFNKDLLINHSDIMQLEPKISLAIL